MVDIRVTGLVKSFDLEKKILNGLSFQVDSGERVGLLGKNGAGKTTLFRMLTGELEPDEGEIQLGAGRRVGLISQIPVYPAGYTVEDVLRSAFARMYRMKDEMDALALRMEQDVIPDDVKDIFKSGDYQMMVIVSEYASATDEVNKQCDEINAIIKKYDNTAMLIGEAPCTKDLIEITDVDFKNVSIISIAAIFIIILLTFKSISLPIILVCVIEFAIFINMGIPAYTGTVLPFIASIVIGTIQLGATVDYAILMTNKYKKNRFRGMDKKEAITDALSKSIQSIIVSALSFFAATFGVGLYSNIDMIGSLCMLMARGAIISMIVVIFILPSMFMVFDRVICASSAGFRNKIK